MESKVIHTGKCVKKIKITIKKEIVVAVPLLGDKNNLTPFPLGSTSRLLCY